MGDFAAVLVVFGLVGYVVLRHCCHRTSFRWDALEWQQNAFESTGLGLLLFAISRLVASPLEALATAGWPVLGHCLAYVRQQLPFGFPATAVLGAAIGVSVSVAANLLWPRDDALRLVVRHHGGSLRILLHEAHRSNRAVMVTLNNRKVYVGWVFTPPPIRRPSHLVMFPTLSGYRASETLRLEWTTNYSPAYEDILERGDDATDELLRFQLVIPLEEVISATNFDIDLYERHFASPPGVGGPEVDSTM